MQRDEPHRLNFNIISDKLNSYRMCVGVISFLHDYNDDDDDENNNNNNNNNNNRRLTLQIRAIYYCERLGTDFFPFFYFLAPLTFRVTVQLA